jgi:hypothetical protein
VTNSWNREYALEGSRNANSSEEKMQAYQRTVRCPEYYRLRRDYEAALRLWGNFLFSPIAHLLGSETRRKAFDERNGAKERLSAHVLSCPGCNSKLNLSSSAHPPVTPPPTVSSKPSTHPPTDCPEPK